MHGHDGHPGADGGPDNCRHSGSDNGSDNSGDTCSDHRPDNRRVGHGCARFGLAISATFGLSVGARWA